MPARPRYLVPQVLHDLPEKMTFVAGPRQVGKTSLVRRVFPDLDYVALDLPAMAEQAERSPESFLATRREPLIVDGIQYAPSLPRHLKSIIDREKKREAGT